MTTKESTSEILPNDMDAEFENFWQRVSCFAANTFPFEERCEFVTKAVDCNASTNVVPYMRLLACELKCVNSFQQVIFITMFVAFCFEILVLLIYVINVYYSPALKAVSRFLHMNEHLAGVTLMAFGNSSADLFSNLASVKQSVPVFANSLSSGLFGIMVSGGLICYISPFKMNAYETIRDILFLILGTLLMDLFIRTNYIGFEVEFLIVFMIYITYILVNVADVYLLRKTLHITADKIGILSEKDETIENQLELNELRAKYDYYSQDRGIEIYERSTKVSITRMRFTTRRMVKTPRISVDRKLTRYKMFDLTQSRNKGIFWDFLLALRPIQCNAWRKADLLNRVLLLLRAPAVLLCTLYIPLVDYEMDKHGWNKLLNCLHILINPALSISVFMCLINAKGNTLWYYAMKDQGIYGVYSLAFTAPLAFLMIIQSRTDVPPVYHWAFTIMNLTGSMFIIFLCATEIDKVLEVIGNLLNIDDDFMGATVKAFTGNLGTLFTNTAVAVHGYPKMAYASAIGGPLFTIIATGNTVIHIRTLVGEEVSNQNQMAEYGYLAFVFLNMGLFLILLWSTTLGGFARRSMGVFSLVTYGIYLVFAVLVHVNIIHSFSNDAEVKAAFGDI
ncbi:mitochondrial sodium/calcium exchanger protein [Drosophila ficusphila]|uniref:mitochondrial sodium/calcium exchanger protein n=1 Tax=Drosophila ficusphila TaxID=30025 RepID=UPI0007E6BEB8|nr:mitochondrial sodium/calcium exchanger protein [Drosophila ficusphila]XP_017044579.1 mitochondrial sodium/calcium exchanger protein [Drosophila ficusphila]